MDRKVPITDATISRNATQHLASTGLRSPCHIQVATRNGEVTLSGIVQYDHQRNAAVQAVRNIEGVKRVIENLKVMPAPKREYKPPPPSKPTAAPPAAEPQPATSGDADAAAPSAPSAETVTSVASPPPAHQEVLPDPTTASTTDVLAGGSQSIDLSFRVDVLPHTAAIAPPIVVQSAAAAASPSVKSASSTVDGGTPPHAPVSGSTTRLRYTRAGEEFSFDCETPDDVEVLRCLLENYADWLKQNVSVGQSKDGHQPQRVTFHSKSVVDFLREQGF